MSDNLTRKAIVTFNENYADGLTKALQAVVAMALEEAAKVFDLYGDDPFTASVVAEHLRKMKDES